MKKKARKEAKHLKEEQSKCNENHNHIYENGAGPSNNYTISSGGQEGNKVLIPIEKSPLKISLRLIPKHGENISIESSEKINTLQKEEYITGGSMLKLRISKQMLHQNSSTSNIQQIEEKREEREARKKKKKETKKRKSVIEEIKEEQPIKKIPRIKIRFGNSIKHKDPQQQQPSPTILSTVPNTSSIMIPLCASQTFEEPPRSINYSDVTTTNFQKEEMKMESERVHFSPCCSGIWFKKCVD